MSSQYFRNTILYYRLFSDNLKNFSVSGHLLSRFPSRPFRSTLKVLPKSRTKSFDPLQQHTVWVLTCGDITVKFIGRQLCQIPPATVIVVVIHPTVNGGLRGLKGCPSRDFTRQLVFHMSEETLLRRIVPAVSLTGHGSPQFAALHQLDKLQTGVMNTLVTVDHSLLVQRDAVVLHQQVHGLQNEVYLQGST